MASVALPLHLSIEVLMHNQRNKKKGLTAGATVATFVLLGGGVAAAATPHGGFAGRGRAPGAFGTLESVHGSTLTVKSSTGATEKVTVTTSTTYEKTTTGTISLLKNGDKVTAIGSLSSGSLDASRVTIGSAGAGGFFGGRGGARPGSGTRPAGSEAAPPAGAAGGGAAAGGPGGAAGFTFVTGTASDVGKTSFTLTESSGTKGTVHVASSTTFSDTAKITEAKLTVGQSVTVIGTKAKSGTITATSVVEGKLGGFGGGFGGGYPGRPPAA
jgi:hypothetical protein